MVMATLRKPVGSNDGEGKALVLRHHHTNSIPGLPEGVHPYVPRLMLQAQQDNISCFGRPQPLNPHVLVEIRFAKRVTSCCGATTLCCAHCCKTQERGVQSLIFDLVFTALINFWQYMRQFQ